MHNGKMNKNSNRFEPYNKPGNKNDCNQNTITNEEGNSKKFNRFQSPYAPATIRLLGRRYPLTKDGRKYLEIGIIIKNEESFTEIALGEIYKKEIIFNLKDWKKLTDYRQPILNYLHLSIISETSFQINSNTKLILEKYKNRRVIHFIQENNSLILAESTVAFLLTLDICVTTYVESLRTDIYTLNIRKLEIFKNAEDIESHEEYDKSSIIDNELRVLYFNK